MFTQTLRTWVIVLVFHLCDTSLFWNKEGQIWNAFFILLSLRERRQGSAQLVMQRRRMFPQTTPFCRVAQLHEADGHRWPALSVTPPVTRRETVRHCTWAAVTLRNVLDVWPLCASHVVHAWLDTHNTLTLCVELLDCGPIHVIIVSSDMLT